MNVVTGFGEATGARTLAGGSGIFGPVALDEHLNVRSIWIDTA
jgi:hypothetical protein